jgi:DNA ligase-associated metallophosphoesterase
VSDVELTLRGERFVLLPERAVFWPAASTLLVADLHWGKDQSFRRHGIPLPTGDLDEELERLATASRRTEARRIVVLGDLIHDATGMTDEVVARVTAARRSILAVPEFVLVRGNHDRHLPRMPAPLGIEERHEPWLPEGRDGRFALAHDADAAAEALGGPAEPLAPYLFCGHRHPTVRLRPRRSGDSLRMPCFHVESTRAHLPAFCRFSNGPPVERRADDRVFAVVEETVVEV